MVRIPDATRDAMVGAAVAAVQSLNRNLLPEDVCKTAVDAAIMELERRLNLGKADPKATSAGGNLFETGPTALGGPPDVLMREARARGYSGDACPQCGNFRMKRTGMCLTCQDCAYNKGCD